MSLARPDAITRGALAVLLLSLLPGLASTQDKPQSGTVRIHQVQVALLLSGNLGGGELDFNGKTYEFTIGGLGVGGIGVSSLDATGTVHGLKDAADFEGVYGQARYGYAAGNESAGKLFLQNPAGVEMVLQADRAGLALSLGADGVVVKLK